MTTVQFLLEPKTITELEKLASVKCFQNFAQGAMTGAALMQEISVKIAEAQRALMTLRIILKDRHHNVTMIFTGAGRAELES